MKEDKTENKILIFPSVGGEVYFFQNFDGSGGLWARITETGFYIKTGNFKFY